MLETWMNMLNINEYAECKIMQGMLKYIRNMNVYVEN